MVTSFDSADWFLGLALVGGASIFILVAGLLGGRPFAGFLAAAFVFVLGIAVAIGIDSLLQIATGESFWQTGTHKRHAMRAFAPFGVGLCVGTGVLLLILRWLRSLNSE